MYICRLANVTYRIDGIVSITIAVTARIFVIFMKSLGRTLIFIFTFLMQLCVRRSVSK